MALNLKAGLLFASVLLLSTALLPLAAANRDVLPNPPFNISSGDLASYLGLGDKNLSFPALFVFGDSYLDSGNNNYLNGSHPSNYTPYGCDFASGKATGRVTNGRTATDFIAQLAGLPFPPAYKGMTVAAKAEVRTGVNYASATDGVLAEPLSVQKLVGPCFSLDQQIQFFEENMRALRPRFSSNERFADYLAQSIIFVHVSSNDLLIYWFEAFSKQYKNDSLAYNHYLSGEFEKRLERLYHLGGRKFFVNNVSPLGCSPFVRNFFHLKTECDEQTNLRILSYNQLLSLLLPRLQLSLKGSKFVLGDLNKIFHDIYLFPSFYGFSNVRDSCCITMGKNDGASACQPDSAPCPDRASRMFFDPNHPTESTHFLWARRVLKDATISHPCTLVGLIESAAST